ncbi:MAG: TetR/AcrR family transcriptional regulator [Gammaproteobacteria bacterium]|nr:TetR/AcrR family transcriptional regulator [Gammaproteobacteria bacterium]
MPKDVFYKINDEKKNRLVKPALKAFLEDEYDNLTVSSITQTMNILRTDFYYYFKDKDDVFEAVKYVLVSRINGVSKPNNAYEAIDNLFTSLFGSKRLKNKAYYIDLGVNYKPHSLFTFAKLLLNEYSNEEYNEIDEIKVATKLHLFMMLMVKTIKDPSKAEESFEILSK